MRRRPGARRADSESSGLSGGFLVVQVRAELLLSTSTRPEIMIVTLTWCHGLVSHGDRDRD